MIKVVQFKQEKLQKNKILEFIYSKLQGPCGIPKQTSDSILHYYKNKENFNCTFKSRCLIRIDK